MYIHYAEITLPAGQFVQIKYAEYSQGRWNRSTQKNEFFISKLSWNNVIAPINAYIKQIPSSKRAWDDQAKVWTIPQASWLGVLPIIRAMGVTTKKWDDLYQDLIYTNSDAGKEPQAKIPDASEFFYEQPQSQSQQGLNKFTSLTREEIEEKLKIYFAIDSLIAPGIDLKKLYRRVAMKLHPDVNGGDSSKMSEFNFIWQEYQKGKGM